MHTNVTTKPPDRFYAERQSLFDGQARLVERVCRRLSWLRLVVALGFLAAAVGAVLDANRDPRPWLLIAGFAAIGFVALALVHDRRLRQRDRLERLRQINHFGLARLARRWSDLPPALGMPPPDFSAMSRDLGIFGDASLFRLLAGALSPPGREVLTSWLLEPPTRSEIEDRQAAIRSLAGRQPILQDLALECSILGDLEPQVDTFLDWAESAPWLRGRPGWIAVSWLLPALTVTLAAIASLGVLPWWPFGLLALVQFVLANLLAGRLSEQLDRVGHREREMQTYAQALRLVEGWAATENRETPAWLRRRWRDLTEGGSTPSGELARLHNHLELADARYSGTLHFVLSSLLLWDLHSLRRLEVWQHRSGCRVRRWLQILGEVEAVSALATLHHDEPGWAFPVLQTDAGTSVAATGLGHPLLPAATRVCNDVQVGPPGHFLLVTGSNMSGKSTLLRAIGLNLVLAQAGGPACVQTLTMPPVRLATSILVEDSLTDGVSLFLAELLRLRSVVRASQEQQGHPRRLLFLLDEILRGTNSRDRHVAVRRVLQRLLESGAIGAISTHDIALGEAAELEEAADCVHFRETLLAEPPPGSPPMHFDYTLRPGVSPTTNALALLEWVGFPDERDSDGSTGYDSSSPPNEESP